MPNQIVINMFSIHWYDCSFSLVCTGVWMLGGWSAGSGRLGLQIRTNHSHRTKPYCALPHHVPHHTNQPIPYK